MADCDTSPILEPTEHDFDAIAPLVSAFVGSHGLGRALLTRESCRTEKINQS
jgi:hypothetical protein